MNTDELLKEMTREIADAAELGASYAEQARAALAVVPMTEWQPIETAPKDGVFVLITDGDVVQIGYYEDHLMAWRSYEDQCRLWSDPTHWQPLPAPPERAST